MDLQDEGIWYRSNDITYTAGGIANVDLTFLNAARAGDIAKPVITEFEVIFNGSVADATSTAGASDDGKAILSQLLIRDGAGTRVNLRGVQVATLMQLEYGSSYRQSTAIATNTTDAAYFESWRIPFAIPSLGERANDTAMPLGHLLQGGRVQLSMASSLVDGTTPINSGTFNLRVKIRDERRPEAKARLVWDRVTVSAAEDNYAINGSLRAAWMDVYDSNGPGLNDASGITEIDSKTLQFFDKVVNEHIEDYRVSTRDHASNDYFLATSTARHVPVWWPKHRQKIGAMPDIQSLHFKQDTAAIADQELVFCKIEDRSAQLTAAHFGMSTTQYLTEIASRGLVVSPKGNHTPAGAMPPNLRSRLPLILGGAVG